MPKVNISHVSIAYQDEGRGFPVVFAHEFAGDMTSWEAQCSHFSERYRVISYNAVGYPPSDVPVDLALYERSQQIANLRGLLSHLGVERAHIVGLSMGAHMAIGFALAHPAMTCSLVAAGAGAGATNVRAYQKDMNARASVLENEGMKGLDTYVYGPTRSGFRQRDPQGWQHFANGFAGHSAEGSARTLRGYQARRPSLYALEVDLRTSTVPTLVIVGDEDEPCLDPSLYLKRTIPRSGLVVMPQTGHAVNIERPTEFNAALDAFFSEVESGGWFSFNGGSEGPRKR